MEDGWGAAWHLKEQLLCFVQSCRGDLSLNRSLKEMLSPIKNDQCPLIRLDAYFQLVSANTQDLIDEAFALRYQVYCIERQFEDPSRQPGGLETDEYDRHAVHSLIIHRPRAEAIGTARLILPQARPNSLPIQQLLKKNGLNAIDYFPNESAAEISRFAISKEFRRRSAESSSCSDTATKRERHGNLPCLGLIQMLLRQSIELGVEYWGAVMEPQLLRMLAQMGIRFQPIGPLVSYHGLRQPSYCHVPLMLRNLALTKPESWAVVTNNGELTCSPARAELRQVA
jgi:N-acyl amino acid synthase of PEP-CTERM/exosortase system